MPRRPEPQPYPGRRSMTVGPELIAVVVFIVTYALIVDERIHRAAAAM